MIKLEEEVIIKHILNKSLCRLVTLKEIMQDIVNKLLVEYSRAPISKN